MAREMHEIGAEPTAVTLADHDAAFGKLCPVHGEHQADYCGAGMNLFREQRLEKEALLAEVRAASPSCGTFASSTRTGWTGSSRRSTC